MPTALSDSTSHCHAGRHEDLTYKGRNSKRGEDEAVLAENTKELKALEAVPARPHRSLRVMPARPHRSLRASASRVFSRPGIAGTTQFKAAGVATKSQFALGALPGLVGLVTRAPCQKQGLCRLEHCKQQDPAPTVCRRHRSLRGRP